MSHPINTEEDFVVETARNGPQRPGAAAALAEYKAAPEKQKTEWAEAYAKPLEEYKTAEEEEKTPPKTVTVDTSKGTVTVTASGDRPGARR